MEPKLLNSGRNWLDFALHENHPLRFSKARGHRIECMYGTVWITAYNELEDHMLTQGQVYVVPNNGQLQVSLRQGVTDWSFVPQQLVQAGFRLTMLKEEEVNLETAFMRLTKGQVQ